jgi:hypothetical protein
MSIGDVDPATIERDTMKAGIHPTYGEMLGATGDPGRLR